MSKCATMLRMMIKKWFGRSACFAVVLFIAHFMLDGLIIAALWYLF